MAIRIYSDKTQKFYNSVDEANRAEFELKEKENLEKIRKEREAALAKEQKEKEAAERKAAAENVENARKRMIEAQKAYKDVLQKFCKDYGPYHMTFSGTDAIPALFDWIGDMFHF